MVDRAIAGHDRPPSPENWNLVSTGMIGPLGLALREPMIGVRATSHQPIRVATFGDFGALPALGPDWSCSGYAKVFTYDEDGSSHQTESVLVWRIRNSPYLGCETVSEFRIQSHTRIC
jgi:hypothetical protein